MLGKGERRKDREWSRRTESERVELALELHEVAELGSFLLSLASLLSR